MASKLKTIILKHLQLQKNITIGMNEIKMNDFEVS